MRPSNGPCTSPLQARRRFEELRNLTVTDTAHLETIVRDTHELPAEHDERVADFVRNAAEALSRIAQHVELYGDEFVEQLDRLYCRSPR